MSEVFEFIGFALCIFVGIGVAAWAFGFLTVSVDFDGGDNDVR